MAKAIGYHPITLIKKANAGTRYPPDKLEKISQVLGIATSFLLDESREYVEGQPIPEDAILKTTPSPPAPDIDPMAALLSELLHRKTENRERFGFEAMEKQMERLTAELGSVVEELRLTREELKKTREANDGEHDPD